jgi:TRAP transporter TAXI family solute receptor
LGGRAYPLRIPVDRVGTVDRMVFELALAHIGLSAERLEALGGRAVPARDYHEQLALYRRGDVDALWQFMGIPSPSIAEAHGIRPVKALPLPPTLIDKLAALGWRAAEIPAGAYGAVDRPVPTVAMGTSLGFHEGVPAEVVHAITRTICEEAERVRAIHPAAQDFDPARAHLDGGGPLHAGAARYFRETGQLR